MFEVIKCECNNKTLVWKFPGEDFNTLSQLIVHESQEAIFFKDGKALDHFKAGRYTLHSQNIPIIRKLVNLPFNGQSPFHCEVYFVNKTVSMDINWSTPNAMPIQDPIYKIIVPINVRGQFAVQVIDSKQFLVQLVGTLNKFEQQTLIEYFRGVLMTNIKDYIVKQFVEKGISFLEIQGNLKIISDGIAQYLASEFATYGLRLVNFNIYDIEPVESDASYQKLKQALAKKAEMQVLGYNYQQERAYDFLEIAAANEGTSAEFMGAGLGLGMGMNMGNAVGGFVNNTVTNNITPSQSSIEKTQNEEKKRVCAVCNQELPENAQFCLSCGAKVKQNDNTVICPQCGEEVPKGKFCMACGQSMEFKCPDCGGKLEKEAKFCMNCGRKIGE